MFAGFGDARVDRSDDMGSCRDKPALVQKLWGAGIIAIDAGDYQSVALAADGRVWTWGRGAHGALGLGSTDDAVHPEPVKTLARRPIAAIAAGGGHMVALSVRRRIYTWGCNSSGQLGLGHQDDGLIPVVLADSESWGIAQVCLARDSSRS
jgi:alpha-tubulin suppressor-like RCC1 family protein